MDRREIHFPFKDVPGRGLKLRVVALKGSRRIGSSSSRKPDYSYLFNIQVKVNREHLRPRKYFRLL
jgi:hypothetical protein